MFGISYKSNVSSNLPPPGRHPYSMWFPLPDTVDSKISALPGGGYWNSEDSRSSSKSPTHKRNSDTGSPTYKRNSDTGSPTYKSDVRETLNSDKRTDQNVESFLTKDVTESFAKRHLHKDDNCEVTDRISTNSQSRDGSLCWMISSSGQLYLSLQRTSPDCSTPEKQSSTVSGSRDDDVEEKSVSPGSSDSSPCRVDGNEMLTQLEGTVPSRNSPSHKVSPSSRKCLSLKFGIDAILKDKEKSSHKGNEESEIKKSHLNSSTYDSDRNLLISSTPTRHHDEESRRNFHFLHNFRLDDQGPAAPLSLALRGGLLPPHSQFMASLYGQHSNASRLLPLNSIHTQSSPLGYMPHGFSFQNLSNSSAQKNSGQQLAGPPGFKSPVSQPDPSGSSRGGTMDHRGSHLTLHYPSRLSHIGTPQRDLLHLRAGEFNSGGSYSIMGSDSHRDFNSSSTNLHGSSKKKRSWSRAVFSNLQRKGLEKRFDVQKYVTKPDRRQLAAMLGLTDAQVKVWFQNRRMKWRHQEEAAKKKKEEDMKRQQLQTKHQQVTSSEDYPESSKNSAIWPSSQEDNLSHSLESDEDRVDMASCISDDEEIHPDSDVSSLEDNDVMSGEDPSRSFRIDGLTAEDVRSDQRRDQGRNVQGASDILDLRMGTL